jgi:hypothetical protein
MWSGTLSSRTWMQQDQAGAHGVASSSRDEAERRRAALVGPKGAIKRQHKSRPQQDVTPKRRDVREPRSVHVHDDLLPPPLPLTEPTRTHLKGPQVS